MWNNPSELFIIPLKYREQMTENLETCPWCREGKLRLTGRAGTMGENEEPFRGTSDMHDYLCDNCGYRKPVKLREYTD